jgi:hypothetical protein
MRSHIFMLQWKQLAAKSSFSKLIYFNEIFTDSFNYGQNVPSSNASGARQPRPKIT